MTKCEPNSEISPTGTWKMNTINVFHLKYIKGKDNDDWQFMWTRPCCHPSNRRI